MKIIVDAMGGDNAPFEIIKGSQLALDEFDIDEIILTGDKNAINKCVKDNNITLKKTTIDHASPCRIFSPDRDSACSFQKTSKLWIDTRSSVDGSCI